MPGPRSFAQKMRAFADDIPKQLNEIKKAAVAEIVLTIVPATPVRTGQARSGYFTTVTSPNLSSLPFGPFTKDGYQSIERMRQATRIVRPGQTMHITNNLPYIGRLNEGYSFQAPAQFTRIATAKAIGIVRRQAIRYRGY